MRGVVETRTTIEKDIHNGEGRHSQAVMQHKHASFSTGSCELIEPDQRLWVLHNNPDAV